MSIPDALPSDVVSWTGEVWRLVEGQHRVVTLSLTDSLDDQALLEEEIEEVKPLLPPECAGLHPLLAAPFRYASYPEGSRFRRANQREGVFYAAERVITAVAEMAFYRFLFLAESPGTSPPAGPAEYSAFSVQCHTDLCVDLTTGRLASHADIWRAKNDYSLCQEFADRVRAREFEAIRYRSVRDPEAGCNLALLNARSFADQEPRSLQTWHLFIRGALIQAWCEWPKMQREYHLDDFAGDPRLETLKSNGAR